MRVLFMVDNTTVSPTKTASHEPDTRKAMEINKTTPQIELNSTSLNHWVTSILNNNQSQTKETAHSTQELSRFGLQTSEDVITFLESPAGETTRSEITAMINLETAIQKKRQQDEMEQQIFMHRLMAFLFLSYIAEKLHAVDVKDIIIEQNKKTLKDELKAISNSSSTTNENPKIELQKAISDYQKAIDTVEEKRQQNALEQISIEEHLVQLVKQSEQLKSQYKQYEESLIFFDQSIEGQPELNNDQIEENINTLKDQMDQLGLIIKDLFDKKRLDEARILLNQQNSLNLQAANYHDMLSVNQNRKYCLNLECSPASFKDAQFILSIDKKIEKDSDGKFYLLNANQDLKNLNNEDKEKANKQFENSKPDLMIVKQVVQHNKGLETNLNQQSIVETTQKQQIKKNDGILLLNQRNLLQSAKASAESMLNDPSLSKELPKQTATARPSPTPKSSPELNITNFYKNALADLKGKVSPNKLFELINKAPGDRVAASSFLENYIKENRLNRTAPIHQTQRDFLLRNLSRYGINTNNPSVTSIEQPATHRSPSPLSTMPNPYKTK